MLIRGRSTRVSQPTGPVEIDWANPLSAGLALDSRGDLFFREDAAGRVPSQSVGQLTRQATPFGVAAGLASAVTSFGDVELFTGSQVAFQVFEIPANLTQVAGLVNKRSSATSQNSFSFGYNYNAANEFTVDIGDGAGTAVGINYRFSTSTFSTAGNNLIILIDGQAGTGQKIRVFRNGVAALNVLNNADNTFSAFTNTTAPLEIGRVNNATLYYAGGILLVRAWNRLLTPDEVGTLSDNPWQLYRPAERRVWLSDVAGGGGGTNYPVSIAESIAAVEATSAAASLGVSVSETAIAAETVASIVSVQAAIAEVCTALDSAATSAAFTSSISESAVAAEQVAAASAFQAAFSDAATALDTVSADVAAGGINVFVAESVVAAVLLSTQGALNAFVDEGAQAQDAILTNAALLAALNEAAQALDTPRTNRTELVSISENARALVAVTAALLWNAINDNQTSNWQNVPDAQTPGWTDVNDTQAPGWTDINN